jgi:putative ABC transport system permease protein
MLILKLLIRNAFRHRLRSGLTILGITIAILAFGLLRTVITTWYLGVEASSASRLVVRNSVSLIFPLPLSYKDRIRQVEGVTLVSYGNWFGAYYIDKKNFFANFAVEPRTYLELYPELIMDPGEKNSFLRDRRGCVAGIKLVEKFGWKIGQGITLQGTIYPGNWDFVLKGIYRGRDRSVDETQFFFHWDYLNETMKRTTPARADQIGFLMVGVRDPEIAAQVAAAIDSQFKNSIAETLTETEKAFTQSFLSMAEAIIIAIRVVSLLVIIIILAVVANTMAMTTRERTGEYAILKTLGYGPGAIAVLIFGESLLITLLGCAVGIIFTFPVASAFGQALSSYFPYFNVETETLYLDAAAAVLVGVLAAIIPARRAIRIRIADGLRKVG